MPIQDFNSDVNSQIQNTSNSGINTSNPSSSNKANAFKFIKSKNTNPLNNSVINVEKEKDLHVDNTNKKSDFMNLDNLLSEKENYFNSIMGKENLDNNNDGNSVSASVNEINKGTSEYEKMNQDNLYTDSDNINDQNLNKNSENIFPLNSESKKGGFNFLKKKVTESNLNSNANLINNETPNKPQKEYDNNLDDMNSDTKSFRSLRINNNIKYENISVNFDNNDEDNKSIKNMNNTSAITNPLRENLSYNPPITNISSDYNKPKQNLNQILNKKFNLINPEQMKQKLLEEITKSEDMFKDLIMKIHSIKLKQQIRENELSEYKNQLENLYKLEEEAIQNNNFDEAQEIENEISNIKDYINKINNQMQMSKEEMMDLREQELIIFRKKWNVLEETFNKFSKLKNQQEYELDNFQNTDMNKHKNNKIKIKKLKEKLDFLKSGLDSDRNFIDEEEEKITKVIKSQSSEVFEELDELNINKNVILEEIENLKRLLDQKYSELDTVEKNIESKEIEIDAIKSNFNHEFNKINFKKKNYEEGLKDYQDQEILYQNMLTQYENDESKYDDKIKNMKKNISDLDSECIDYNNQILILNDDMIKKEFLLKNENEINSKIYLIQMKLDKTNKLLEKNLEEIQTMELMIRKLEAEILGWDMKIPTLEEEKKGFVTLKNFKEAGRVTNELKNIFENKNKNLSKITENHERIKELKDENEHIYIELNKINDSKSLEEQELNITRYEYLIGYKEMLKSLHSRLMKVKDKNDVYYIEEEIVFLDKEIKVMESLDYIKAKFKKQNVIEGNVSIEKDEDMSPNEEVKSEPIINQDEISNNEEVVINVNEEQNIDNEENIVENENTENDDVTPIESKINIEEIKEQIEEITQEQQKCIEIDDFDKAEALQLEIDILTKKLEKCNLNIL